MNVVSRVFHDRSKLAYGQPLSIINLACAEERIHGVVCWDDEGGDVGQESTSEVEEDEEEVDSDETEDSVGLWDIGLSLKVVENWVSGELQRGAS